MQRDFMRLGRSGELADRAFYGGDWVEQVDPRAVFLIAIKGADVVRLGVAGRPFSGLTELRGAGCYCALHTKPKARCKGEKRLLCQVFAHLLAPNFQFNSGCNCLKK
jgi:hypothetical protein